jgi:hypothetical protein
MNFLFANAHELAALMELPYIQRLVYLMGIRPYMDRQSNIVGIKRRISYQSLRETLYVGPIAGVKTGSPSLQQMKRAVKSLERSGLVIIQSTERHLILKCILAELDKSVPKKAELRTNLEPDISLKYNESIKSDSYDTISRQADIDTSTQADPPHKSEVNYIYLYKKFEKFWESYPQKKSKQKAWYAFKKLNPDDALFSKIITTLNDQLIASQQPQQSKHWTPPWKFPANWVEQECWNDEIQMQLEQVNTNEQRRSPHKKQTSIDILWKSCKAGVEHFNFDFEDEPKQTNIDTQPINREDNQ